MALPIAMNSTMISTEGLKRSGITRPTPEDVDRANRIWLPEILSDICYRCGVTGNTRMKSLEREVFLGLIQNQRSYTVPEDMEDECVLSLYKAEKQAQAVSASVSVDPNTGAMIVHIQMTLDIAGIDAQPIRFDQFLGNKIFFSAPEAPTAYGYWLVAAVFIPGSTGSFIIPDSWDLTLNSDAEARVNLPLGVSVAKTPTQLEEVGWREHDHHFYSSSSGTPYYFIKNRNRFELDIAPLDGSFLLHARYFANVNSIDWSKEPFPKIYSLWRQALVRGVQTTMFLEKSDLDSYKMAKMEYDNAVENVIRNEVPYGGQMTGFSFDPEYFGNSGGSY